MSNESKSVSTGADEHRPNSWRWGRRVLLGVIERLQAAASTSERPGSADSLADDVMRRVLAFRTVRPRRRTLLRQARSDRARRQAPNVVGLVYRGVRPRRGQSLGALLPGTGDAGSRTCHRSRLQLVLKEGDFVNR
jgi:hypothetical protein